MLLKGPMGSSGGVLFCHPTRIESSFPHLATAQRKRLEIARGTKAAGESAPQSGAWRYSPRRPEREGVFSLSRGLSSLRAAGLWKEGM